MSISNNECALATTSDHKSLLGVVEWIETLGAVEQKLFVTISGIANNAHTIVLVPSGSPKGWLEDEKTAALRTEFIHKLESLNYEDGSNPFSWVEIGYGECGQKILRGNNTNKYNDEQYYYED